MTSKLYWPELYGFSIYGNGPCYVIYVESASIGDTGGLKSGDRIIELDEQNVSNLSSGVIKFMARNSKRNPPSISVQSSSFEIELLPSKKFSSYGFKVIGNLPVFIESLVEKGPAYTAGLRQGDILFKYFSIFNEKKKQKRFARWLFNLEKLVSVFVHQFTL
jgi:S1-C subfamily serine protease